MSGSVKNIEALLGKKEVCSWGDHSHCNKGAPGFGCLPPSKLFRLCVTEQSLHSWQGQLSSVWTLRGRWGVVILGLWFHLIDKGCEEAKELFLSMAILKLMHTTSARHCGKKNHIRSHQGDGNYCFWQESLFPVGTVHTKCSNYWQNTSSYCRLYPSSVIP